MAYPFPRGVSGIVDPEDEPYLRLLEHCAKTRRGLGLPFLNRAELEALLKPDAPARRGDLPPNVLPFPVRRARRRGDNAG